MDEKKVIKHNSFGNLCISRCFGGTRHLYGSSIEHSNFITLKISHSELHRHLKKDWYHATKPIVEITMSQAQFAEAITSLNVGDGVPVTINYTEKDGMADPTPFESKYDTFKEEFSFHIDEINKETKNIRNEIAKMFEEKKSIGKADREAILSKLDMIIQEMGSNTKFIQKQFHEQMDKTVVEAKAEIEAFTQNKLTSIGLDAIKNGPDIQLISSGDNNE
jgi:hypothetical protein